LKHYYFYFLCYFNK